MSQAITAISQASSAVVTFSASTGVSPWGVGTQLTFASVGGMTQINGLTGTVTAIGGTSGAWTATVNINSSAFTAYTSGGTATLTVNAGDLITVAVCTAMSNTVGLPSGFAQVTGTTPPNDGNLSLTLYGKVAGGSEPSSYAFTGTSFGASANLRVNSGRNITAPYASAPPAGVNQASSAAPITFSIPGMTAAAGDDVLVFEAQSFATNNPGTLSFTPSSGYGVPVLANDTVSSGGMWGTSSSIDNVAGGTTGAIAGTISIVAGTATNTGYLAQVISLARASTNTASIAWIT
jgi:hypothetical protein